MSEGEIQTDRTPDSSMFGPFSVLPAAKTTASVSFKSEVAKTSSLDHQKSHRGQTRNQDSLGSNKSRTIRATAHSSLPRAPRFPNDLKRRLLVGSILWCIAGLLGGCYRFCNAVVRWPVVVLTSREDDEYALQTIESGTQDCLTKDSERRYSTK